MEQLREAILITIGYGRIFGVEYGYKEIGERLISEKIYPEKEIKIKLREMKRPDVKRHNNKILENKINKVEILGWKLAKIFKNILLVGITGSVAASYPKENEDIDLMIITKNNSLWITRLGVKIWTLINRVPQRKYGLKGLKDEFCFNLWLEEQSLILPIYRQNLKNAMDLILMKPVINKNKIYEKFIKENQWVKKYVATGYNKKNINYQLRITGEEQKTNIITKTTNRLAFWLQYVYMKRKLTEETVDLKRAFFHPKNRR